MREYIFWIVLGYLSGSLLFAPVAAQMDLPCGYKTGK